MTTKTPSTIGIATLVVSAALALALAGTSRVTAQPRPDVAVALPPLLVEWLTKDCGLSDAALWRGRLRAEATQFTPLLIAAAREGPQAPMRADVEQRARQEFEARRAALESGGAAFLSDADRRALLQESVDAHVAKTFEEFAAGYRQRAIGGLGAIASDEAIRALEETIKSGRPDLREAARIALTQARTYRARANAR
jgi:hypothetical protein